MTYSIDLSAYHDPVWVRLTDSGRFDQRHIDPLEEPIFEFVVSGMGEAVRVEIVNQKTGCVERFYFD